MQDKTGGKKYLDFHQKLLTGRGQIDKARALAAAKEVGLDMARLEKDMASAEVKATLEESFKLAEALGLNGTPSYVVGNDVVIGAVGAQRRCKEKINNARCGKADLLKRHLADRCADRIGKPVAGPRMCRSRRLPLRGRVALCRGFPFAPEVPISGDTLAAARHGEDHLRPQRPEPQSARHPRAGDLRPRDA